MRNLIIPDVHLRKTTVEAVLNHERFDKVYFLGDFFDNFGDTPQQNADIAKFINVLMERFDAEFCIGNHDTSYFWKSSVAKCSGFTTLKEMAVNNFLNRKAVSKRFKWHHVVDGWLLSHAGLHPAFVETCPFGVKSLENIDAWLKDEAKDAEKALNTGRRHWFYEAGRSRGGRLPFGGITWCDVDEEFTAVEGIKQIFGHTPHNVPYWVDSNNLALDTHLRHYAIMENGKIEIRATAGLL